MHRIKQILRNASKSLVLVPCRMYAHYMDEAFILQHHSAEFKESLIGIMFLWLSTMQLKLSQWMKLWIYKTTRNCRAPDIFYPSCVNAPTRFSQNSAPTVTPCGPDSTKTPNNQRNHRLWNRRDKHSPSMVMKKAFNPMWANGRVGRFLSTGWKQSWK